MISDDIYKDHSKFKTGDLVKITYIGQVDDITNSRELVGILTIEYERNGFNSIKPDISFHCLMDSINPDSFLDSVIGDTFGLYIFSSNWEIELLEGSE